MSSIRYAKEIPGMVKIIANVTTIHEHTILLQNIRANEVSDSVFAVISSEPLKVDHNISLSCIDLGGETNPSAALDTCVQLICDGGLLIITSPEIPSFFKEDATLFADRYAASPIRCSSSREVVSCILLFFSFEYY